MAYKNQSFAVVKTQTQYTHNWLDSNRLDFWNQSQEHWDKVSQNYLPTILPNNSIGTESGKISLQYGIVYS